MSQQGIEQLIGKSLADLKFFEEFLKDPEKKIQETNLDISGEELQLIKQVDKNKARKFAESFSKNFADRKQSGM